MQHIVPIDRPTTATGADSMRMCLSFRRKWLRLEFCRIGLLNRSQAGHLPEEKVKRQKAEWPVYCALRLAFLMMVTRIAVSSSASWRSSASRPAGRISASASNSNQYACFHQRAVHLADALGVRPATVRLATLRLYPSARGGDTSHGSCASELAGVLVAGPRG